MGQDDNGANYFLKKMSENTYNLSSLNHHSIEKLEALDVMGRSIKANFEVLNLHSVNIDLSHKGQVLIRFQLNGDAQLLRIYN